MTALRAKTEEPHRSKHVALLGAMLTVFFLFWAPLSTSLFAQVGTGSSFLAPRGVAVEADGNLVVVDQGLAAVVRVDPVTGDRTIVSGLNIGVNTAVEEDTPLPEAFALVSNYPNPFRSATTLSFTLTRPEVVHLTIYDLLGRHVATLVDGLRTAQQHTVRWEAGGHASGLYLARMQVGSTVRTIKLLLVK